MPTVTPRAPAQSSHLGARTQPAHRAPSFVLDASILAALLAASSAPTPLYPHYQDAWALSALTITAVFSAYSLTLLLALLTTGALSDHLGRRPVLVGALLLEAASMVLLASADSAGALITGRILQGAATGAATSAAGAALLDLHDPLRPGRSALTNSIAPVAGMAAGVLASTLLVRFAPAPTVTVYVLLAVLFAAQAIAVTFTAETARPHAGALRSLLPHLAVPPSARRALLAVGTAVVSIWALGGFYSSLGPALVHLVAPGASQAAGGLVFFVLTAAATLTMWTLRRTAPRAAATGGSLAVIPSAALSLLGLHGASLPAVYGGAALAGVAFGAVSQGALRMTLASLHEQDRAATLAAYYVLSYLSMSLPAIAAGAATQHYGLRTTAYALAAALLAVAAVAALAVSRRRAAHSAHNDLPQRDTRKRPIMSTPPATDPTAIPSWTVGDVIVHRIDEVLLPPATGPWLLPGATPDVVNQQDWLRPHFADGEGILHIDSHSFAFTVGGLRILVDTGIGNGKERANPAWHNLNTDYLPRLTAAGFPPDSVDLVILTHLHADHVGWNAHEVNGEWVPTFPNARYITSRVEREFWAGYDMEEARKQMFRDSVIPVEEAGLLDLVDIPADGVEVVPGLRLIPTPGHTPGHVALELTSRGETALITGDCIHHPVQLAHPTIGACVDIEPERSEASRRTLLGSLVGTDTLVLGTHFAPPTAGRVVAHEGAYRLSPVPADSH